MAEKNITVNLYKAEAAEYVHILPSDAYGIETETLQMVTNKGEETPFVITRENESNLYKISVKESQRAKIKPGNYAVKILVKTSVEEAAHELELKINVEKKLPKVTLKQGSVVALENGKWEVNATTEALNLYEKNAYGVIWASSDEAKISEVSYEAKDKDGIPRIVEAEESLQGNIFSKDENVLVKTADVTGKNYTKTKNKGTITVRFEGYLPQAVYQKEFTVSVNKTLPVIMAVPSTNILYPETIADVAQITLVDKVTNKKLALNEGYEANITKQPSGCASNIGHIENCIELIALKNAKGGTAEYEIRGENWLDEVKVFSKFTIKIGKAPTLVYCKINK